MARSLRENLSSGYVGAANKLRPRNARHKIVAYVESYDDIFFWRTILSGFEDETRYFEVMLPSRVNRLERGKKAALMELLHGRVGQDMIACVDADYDYLIQGATPMSREIIRNAYVFHTYAYAIENLQCYAPSLHDVTVAVALNDHSIFDFQEFIERYSEAVFPLFVWNVWFYRSNHYGEFTITDFNAVIDMGNFRMHEPESLLANLRRKVSVKVQQLQRKYLNAKEGYLRVKDELGALGVTDKTTYLYVQGHHLFDNVIVPMLSKVCDKLVWERESEIYRQSKHHTQMRNELSSYNHSQETVIPMLRRNMGYLNSGPVKKIKADIEKYINTCFKHVSANASGINHYGY